GVVTGVTDDRGVSGDAVTADNALVLRGTAEPLSTVELFRDGLSLGTTVADGTGQWSFDQSGTALPDGRYLFTARASDAAGNVSAARAGVGEGEGGEARGPPRGGGGAGGA